jgi:hypothetical protein
MGGEKMNIPKITSINTALRIYYNHPEIGNKEITALFGRRSSATIVRLKKIVKAQMDALGMPSYGANKVNTVIAFQVWGLDVADLERRKKKLKDLDL